MNYRLAKILASEDVGTAGTKVIDINIADVISRIDIVFRTKNGDAAFNDHPAANLSKIELVDGSDVLFSLSGREAQALNFYDRLRAPDNHLVAQTATWMRASFGLDFGRHLFDPELAFDPTKFTNPQLKITWDENVANEACTNNYLMIQAHLFDELKPSPAGFLMSKQVYSYTPEANAYEYITLPTDYPFRKLLFGSHQEYRTFTQMIADVRLSEDNDKRIPFDMTGHELLWEMQRTYPEYIETVYSLINAAPTLFRVTPSEDAIIVGTNTGAMQDLYIVFQNGGLVKGEVDTGGETVYMICKGYIPHGLASIPFGDPAKPADWYDVTKIGDLRLRVKGGPDLAATPTAQIITQQLRSYT